jgi:hypothetical protein
MHQLAAGTYVLAVAYGPLAVSRQTTSNDLMITFERVATAFRVQGCTLDDMDAPGTRHVTASCHQQ